jgi:hypothetical protein
MNTPVDVSTLATQDLPIALDRPTSDDGLLWIIKNCLAVVGFNIEEKPMIRLLGRHEVPYFDIGFCVADARTLWLTHLVVSVPAKTASAVDYVMAEILRPAIKSSPPRSEKSISNSIHAHVAPSIPPAAVADPHPSCAVLQFRCSMRRPSWPGFGCCRGAGMPNCTLHPSMEYVPDRRTLTGPCRA